MTHRTRLTGTIGPAHPDYARTNTLNEAEAEWADGAKSTTDLARAVATLTASNATLTNTNARLTDIVDRLTSDIARRSGMPEATIRIAQGITS